MKKRKMQADEKSEIDKGQQVLLRLARLFPCDKPLYLVGGSVRNGLLGLDESDKDICSSLLSDEIEELLDGSEFRVVAKCRRLGTLIIYQKEILQECDGQVATSKKENNTQNKVSSTPSKENNTQNKVNSTKGNEENKKCGGEVFEYTTFRTDSYPNQKGDHFPLEVKFTKDIAVDARRRDFSINAIYQNILTKEIIDPTGGIDDLRRGVIRTADRAEVTLSEDALRIMRLVRFAAELGMKIDEETFIVAKEMAFRISDISSERLQDELEKILSSDCKYGKVEGHYKGLTLLDELGIMTKILPRLEKARGVLQNPKYHKYDVLSHSIEAARYSPLGLRLVALLHDVGKPYAEAEDGNMHRHASIGERLVREMLGAKGLKYPCDVIARTAKLVAVHMFNKDGSAKPLTVRKFIAENYEIIPDIIALQRADKQATGVLGRAISADILEKAHAEIMRLKIPISQKMLQVNGNDMIALGLVGKEIKDALSEIVNKAIETLSLTDRIAQEEYAKQIAFRIKEKR